MKRRRQQEAVQFDRAQNWKKYTAFEIHPSGKAARLQSPRYACRPRLRA